MAKRKQSKRSAMPSWAESFADADPAVRDDLRAAEPLHAFLSGVTELTRNERLHVVEQARIVLEQVYVHLRLKESMHAVEPLQRLRLLEHRIDQVGADLRFHREMTEIFTSLRDLHTVYVLPSAYQGRAAFLPFLIEEYFETPRDRPHYLVSHWIDPFTHSRFEKGSEILFWNGVPIRRAIELNADRHAGSNTEARRARGVDSLTIRSLAVSAPPDEEWVVVNFRTPSGEEDEIRFDWLVAKLSDMRLRSAGPDGREGAVAVDVEGDLIRKAKRSLFAPQTLHRSKKKAPRGEVSTAYPETFLARAIETVHGTFGHLRIRSFGQRPPRLFVPELRRLLAELPREGLILDVRDNGGGYVWNAEQILQFFTPREIHPEPAQFINSSETRALTEAHDELAPWRESIRQSLETGAVYSKGVPLTPPERCNDVGQLYHGPVVLITNAKCYSATDMFAAGFQDHEIGTIFGVHDRTGAGGANVWQHRAHLVRAYQRPDSPFEALPKSADLTVSIRRTLRVGDRLGTPVEDLGVHPDARHYMTRNDLLEDNIDLLNAAGKILAGETRRTLDVTVSRSGDALDVHVTTLNVSNLDLYLDGRPVLNDVRTPEGEHAVRIPDAPGDAVQLEVRGFYRRKLVAARKLRL